MLKWASRSRISNKSAVENAEACAQLKLLEDRSYKTYKSRLAASERLASRGRAWNLALISTSAATTIASISQLADLSIYGNSGSTLLVCVSVLSLLASLVTSGQNYSGRSRDMFLNYRRIQRLSAEAERAQSTPKQSLKFVKTLNSRYDALLDESENHTAYDYFKAFPEDAGRTPRRERLLSAIPFAALGIPVGLIIPLALWIVANF